MAQPQGSLQDKDFQAFIVDTNDNGVNRRVEVMNGASNPVPVDLSSLTSGVPTIFNISVPLANTEVSQALPANFKKILIRARGLTKTQFAFVATQSATNFIQIPSGASYSDSGLLGPALTLYVQTSLAAQVVEVLTWS